MAQLGIESVLVAGRGPAACAVVIGLRPAGREVRGGALRGRALGPARAPGRRRGAARAGAGQRVLPGRRPHRRGRPPQRGQRRPPGAARPRGQRAAGRRRGRRRPDLGRAPTPTCWSGSVATASSRPASAGLLAWVTADGLRFPTPVSRDRAAGIARVSWTPDDGVRPPSCRGARGGWPTSAGAGWSPSASPRTASSPRWPPGSPSTWPSWSGRTGWTPSSWRCAARPDRRGRRGAGRRARARRGRRPAAVDAAAGNGRAGHRPAARDRSAPADGRADGVEVVAVSGYEPGDRLDGWYDALLATVSAGGAGHRRGGARGVRRPRRAAGRRACRTTAPTSAPSSGDWPPGAPSPAPDRRAWMTSPGTVQVSRPERSRRRGGHGGGRGDPRGDGRPACGRSSSSPEPQVAAGDTLVILESMKMEIPVLTEQAGTVQEMHVVEGEVLQEGDLIATVTRT